MNESEMKVRFESLENRVAELEGRMAEYDASFSQAATELKELNEKQITGDE